MKNTKTLSEALEAILSAMGLNPIPAQFYLKYSRFPKEVLIAMYNKYYNTKIDDIIY